MALKKLVGGKIVLEDRVVTGYAIVFDKTIIKVDKVEALLDYDCETIKVDGYISPGFIDTHIHGASSFDFMDDDELAINTIAKAIVKYGTTSFLATTVTNREDRIVKMLDRVKKYKAKQGANLLGVHLEGPFLSKKYIGAQNVKYIQHFNDKLLDNYKDIIKVVTIAPEENGGVDFIQKWSNEKTVLSMGHTNATFHQAKVANELGVSHVTHLFNAMRPFHHRELGAVGASLLLNFTVELITDGYHVDPLLYDFVIKNKGVDKVILVTDSIRATGLGDGSYELGGQYVRVEAGKCTLSSGTLAGSVHTMNMAIKNVVDNTSLKLHEVIQMATANPAKLIGEKKKGVIREGYDADLVVFDDDYYIKEAFILGKKQNLF